MLVKDNMSAYVDMTRDRIETLISLIVWGITNKHTPNRSRLKFMLSDRSEIRKPLRTKNLEKTVIWWSRKQALKR